MTTQEVSNIFLQKTRLAYVWTRILNTPFWVLYTLLPFIMHKDLHASAWQVACFISLKPVVSLFSLYWSGLIKKRSDRLVSNVVGASILGHLPFFFTPFINNPWYFVLASAIYMFFHRGMNPAWMEILKINISEKHRKNVFAYGSVFYHVGGGVLAIALGWILSDYFQAWRWLFPATALCSVLAIFFQLMIPIQKKVVEECGEEKEPPSFSKSFKKPWQDAWSLLKQRPDFTRFQIGFMLAGGGLMLWQPALPSFFSETLNLSYKELAVAMTFCKGVGYAIAIPFWTRCMGKLDIFTFTSIVTLIMTFFSIGLMLAQWHIIYLYGAYLLYGMWQAGSEMSWNLSGPLFAKYEDSSTYSGLNVMTVGLRGCVGPPLGSFLCVEAGPNLVLFLGSGMCLLATWQLFSSRTKERHLHLLAVNPR